MPGNPVCLTMSAGEERELLYSSDQGIQVIDPFLHDKNVDTGNIISKKRGRTRNLFTIVRKVYDPNLVGKCF
jgi:hypothetical protein